MAGLLGPSIGGIIAGIILVTMASLPVCCGVCKEPGATKIIGGLAIGFSLVVTFVPFISASLAIEGAIADVCDGTDCRCSEENKNAMRKFVVGYGYAPGWACIVLAATAVGIGCCACCRCCGPLSSYDQHNVDEATVVGHPVMQRTHATVVGPTQSCSAQCSV